MSAQLSIRILVFIDLYLPVFRAGGPLRTLLNMVELLGREFEFFIITRDHDFGTNEPFCNVKNNSWNKVGLANVFLCQFQMAWV